MPSLWFTVPVHGREKLARICLRQLRRTCAALAGRGVEATAVLIGEPQWREVADEHGFGFVERDNKFLSRKFNDGIQLACDPEFNPRPADYVMPCGSDDWIDHRILASLPAPDEVLCFNTIALVRPDAREMAARRLDNAGGVGLRVYPRQVVALADYRPADEDKSRGCDTSMLINLRKSEVHFRLRYRSIDPRQIVDWKSEDVQVTPYASVAWRKTRLIWDDPFTALEDFYPTEALEEMRGRYSW